MADRNERERDTMPIHSKYGITVKTKLERISRRARANKENVFNNIGHVIDRELLQEKYRQLDGRKAVGIDGVKKTDYGKRLKENLNDLMKRIRRGTYRPKPSRMVEIPKEDGSKRPLAISCLEDKLVQACATAILNEVYEPIFSKSSYGFRPNENCHKALKALMRHTYVNRDGAIVEIDIQKYFNTIPHEKMEGILRKKIKDERFLKLLKTLMRTPTMVGREIRENKEGSPQGSIISPILANVYLHYVVDEWFEKTVKQHIAGRAEMVRFADDMVFIFQHKRQGEKFYKILPERLKKYGLMLHAEKSQIIESGLRAAERASRKGKRLSTYKFLGFVCYWGKARAGFWRLKYKSRPDRFSAKLQGLRRYLWKNCNTPNTGEIINQVIRIIRGWINYHAISDNERRVKSFALKSKRILFRWMNRRGGRRRINWVKYMRILRYKNFPESWKITSMFPKLAETG